MFVLLTSLYQNGIITYKIFKLVLFYINICRFNRTRPSMQMCEKRKSMKKALKITKNILVWTLIVVAVLMMIFTILSVKTFDRNDRSLLGYKAYTVLSDSMSATDFDAGAIVFVKEVDDPATLKPGDIIAYLSQSEENAGAVITHKIRKLTVYQNEPAFITYGTTTNVDDEDPVTYPYVMGKYEFHIPYIGHFFEFLKTTPGYIICIFLPFALLMLYNGINCVKLFRRYRKEQQAEINAERQKLTEEREENARVLAELRALKAQLEGGGAAPQPAAPQTGGAAASAPAPVNTNVITPAPAEAAGQPNTTDAPKASEQTLTRRVRSVPRAVAEDAPTSAPAAAPAPETAAGGTEGNGSEPSALRRPRARRR